MQVPEFLKEVVWSLYPPRYRQLADRPFKKSLVYMSRMLLIAMLLAGLIFAPRLFLLRGTIENELSKLETATLSWNITQSGPMMIPNHDPWVVIDMNSNRTLTKEIFVIDSHDVKYRLFGIRSIPQQDLKEPAAHRSEVSRFASSVLIMMLPGIALLFYLRAWLKYLLLIFVVGTFFFIIMELSKLRLKWVQMLNVATYSLTLIIFVEVISAAITTSYLIPTKIRFLGITIYAVTFAAYAVLMIAGVVGYHLGEHIRKR